MNEEEYGLILTAKSYPNEKSGLIDYDIQNKNKQKLKIKESGSIFSAKGKIIFSPKNENIEPYLRVKKNNKKYTYNVEIEKGSNDLSSISEGLASYIVYKDYFYKGINDVKKKYYKLGVGDILKFGKILTKIIYIKIKEKDNLIDLNNKFFPLINNHSNDNNNDKINREKDISVNNINVYKIKKNQNPNSLQFSTRNAISSNQNLSHQNLQHQNNIYNENIESNDKPIAGLKKHNNQQYKNLIKITKTTTIQRKNLCRICFGIESTEDNPLLYPCKCKGTMKFIHYLCLKNWINTKIKSRLQINKNSFIYQKKEIFCELCNNKFPDYIKYKDKIYNIILFKPNFDEYIIFESLNMEKPQHNYIHIISLENKKNILVGRAKECEFMLPEISLSRSHSIIHKKDGELLIEDNKSKFGTLILIQNESIEIMNNFPLKIQISNTFLKFKLDLPSFFFCCNIHINENLIYDYSVQNKKIINFFEDKDIKCNNTEDEFITQEGKKEENLNSNLLMNDILEEDEKNKNGEKQEERIVESYFQKGIVQNKNKNNNLIGKSISLIKIKNNSTLSKQLNLFDINNSKSQNRLVKPKTKGIENKRRMKRIIIKRNINTNSIFFQNLTISHFSQKKTSKNSECNSKYNERQKSFHKYGNDLILFEHPRELIFDIDKERRKINFKNFNISKMFSSNSS